MELDENLIDAHWTRDKKGDPELFIINEAIISKLCILGEEYEPCFEGASIAAPQMNFSFNEEFKQQLYSMMKELKEILNEGGASMGNEEVIAMEEVTSVVEETPNTVEESAVEEVPAVVEEPAAPEEVVEEFSAVEEEDSDEDVCPECHKPMSECECEEDKKDEYVLEEIPEYMELRNNYSNLENQYANLESMYNALVEEAKTLTEFKETVERKEKESMIKNDFYMLSDADKIDVIQNIDKYTLEEIEAKLSIICVRNKVSFGTESNSKQAEPTTYNLNCSDIVEDSVPAWIKSLQSVAKTMN